MNGSEFLYISRYNVLIFYYFWTLINMYMEGGIKCLPWDFYLWLQLKILSPKYHKIRFIGCLMIESLSNCLFVWPDFGLYIFFTFALHDQETSQIFINGKMPIGICFSNISLGISTFGRCFIGIFLGISVLVSSMQ